MDRRIIPELAAKYKLEPAIRDIYVEGKSDKDILTCFLRRAGLRDCSVFEIDTVEVSPDVLRKYQKTSGQKSRLVALAQELAAYIGQDAPQVTCVVDIDCDHLLGIKIDCKLVLTTNYTCIEMYFFDPVSIEKFLHLVLGVTSKDPAVLLREYADILTELFLIRAANEALQLCLPWIDFWQSCKRNDQGMTFDREKFLRSLLQKAAALGKRDLLDAKVQELRPFLQDDARYRVHGHDFITLLAHDFASEARKRGIQNSSAVSNALRGCLDLDVLRDEVFFRELCARGGANPQTKF